MASATLPYPTHHIVLTDDQGNELGLIAVDSKLKPNPVGIQMRPVEQSSLKMSQGNQSRSDMRPPYTYLEQKEWNGGRGGKTYEDDTTRFWWSSRAETGRQGKIILSGRETYGTGYRTVVEHGPGAMRMIQLLGSQSQLAVKLTTVGAFTLDKVLLWLAYVGAPGNLSVSLCADTAGAPGAAAQTVALATTALQTSILSEPVILDFNTALAATTSYWITVTAATDDATKYWKVGVSEAAGLTKESADGLTWAASAYDLYYRAMDNTAEMDGEFFQYEDELYFITKPGTGASHLWRESAGVWTDVTPAAITASVTSVAVANKLVIFAFGAALDMVGMRKNGANLETVVDTGQKAQFLAMYNDGGTIKLVKTLDTTVSQANEPTWGIQPGWTDSQQVGYTWEAITGLVKYANASGAEDVYVMKEGGPWEYDGGVVNSKNHDEFKAVAGTQLGKVAKKSDVYLFMSVMNSVWRFYDPTFDDVGFTEGLPTEMRGVVSAILPYPGRTLVAVDAGATGYSSIWENNGGAAWNFKYAAPKGERIFSMDIQTVAGALTRLWIRQGADFVWLPMPKDGFDPKEDLNYPYTHEGVVELGNMYAGLQDIWKYWNQLKLQLEDLEANTTWVEADYKLDDGEWTPFPTAFTSMPMDEKAFGATDAEGRTFGVSSKKIKLRLRLYSRSLLKSPTVLALILEGVSVVSPKFTYSLVAHIGKHDLNNGLNPLTPAEQLQRLITWCGTAQSLWMRSINPLHDNKAVFLPSVPSNPLSISEKENEFEYTATVTLQEA